MNQFQVPPFAFSEAQAAPPPSMPVGTTTHITGPVLHFKRGTILPESAAYFSRSAAAFHISRAESKILKHHFATQEKTWFFRIRGIIHFFHMDLAAVNLSGANLADAFLEKADLTNANLDGANVRFAILDQATLTGASLHEADLTGASLYEANLSGADLRGAVLRQASFTGANLTSANLAGAKNFDENAPAITFHDTIMPDGSVRRD